MSSGSDDEFLEMSKSFITTTRRFTKEIKVKKQLSKCPSFYSKLREANGPCSWVTMDVSRMLKEVCGTPRNVAELHVDVVTI
jgi:hypothetical protein